MAPISNTVSPMLRIITVAYKNFDTIETLVKSISEYVEVPFELVIWDNTPRVNGAHLPPFTQASNLIYQSSGKNIGFAKACNLASRISNQSPFTHLLFLNPDARLASKIDLGVFDALKSQPGIIGLNVYNDSEKTMRQQSARSFPHFFTAFTGREGILTRLLPNNPWSKKYLRTDLSSPNKSKTPTQVDWVSGCALFCDRETWGKLEGFDERFFLYVEDVDLGQKAKTLGIPCFYFPIVDVIHLSRTSSNTIPWKSDLYHHMGMWSYWWKWSHPVEKIFFPFTLLGIVTRYVFRRLLGSLGRTSS